MSDRNAGGALGRTSSHISEVGSSSSIRPRNRRHVGSTLDSNDDNDDAGAQSRGLRSPLFGFGQGGGGRSASPLALPKRANPSPNPSPHRVASTGNLGQFFSESWNQGWSSVQDLTTSLFSQDGPEGRVQKTQNGVRKTRNAKLTDDARSWGPSPPTHGPRLGDVAAGSLADRQSALKAARTASVLQSYEGVNGGLDVSGKHKRRDSDEVIPANQSQDEYLVYVHHVLPNDTYAGLILRYKCNEDAFRRANGLWSRDSVQSRKWLTIPVDACEIRGRPCEAPSGDGARAVPVDLLAPTPRGEGDDLSRPREASDDYFGSLLPAPQSTPPDVDVAEDKPWVHVRWVTIDSMPQPVEIGRVSRGAMGYFPPRRRRSIRTISSFSTPRQSMDLSSNTPGSAGASSSRRLSSLGSRPPITGSQTTLSRSRLSSDAATARPVWMQQPGGVGTMSRNVKAPGPDRDYLNTWTKKHIPGLNIEGPSMSIMGSETAQFGFGKDSAGESTGIVESPFQGGDVSATNQNGTPLDRAAAAVETWLRGALAKRPGTPMVGGRSNRMGSPFGGDGAGDLIELADTNSDDGRLINTDTDSLGRGSHALRGTSGRDGGLDSEQLRGRSVGSGVKGPKAD